MNISDENIPLKQYICYFTAPNTLNLDQFVNSRGFDLKGVEWGVTAQNRLPVFYVKSAKVLTQESLDVLECAIKKFGFNTFRKFRDLRREGRGGTRG